jgi:hypothetical protein
MANNQLTNAKTLSFSMAEHQGVLLSNQAGRYGMNVKMLIGQEDRQTFGQYCILVNDN